MSDKGDTEQKIRCACFETFPSGNRKTHRKPCALHTRRTHRRPLAARLRLTIADASRMLPPRPPAQGPPAGGSAPRSTENEGPPGGSEGAEGCGGVMRARDARVWTQGWRVQGGALSPSHTGRTFRVDLY